MKYYRRILDEQKAGHFFVIKHLWGQTKEGIYNQLASIWNRQAIVGDNIFIISKKKFGLKSLVKTINKMGICLNIVGKGENGIRIIEITKNNPQELKFIESDNFFSFEFAGYKFNVDSGEAVFSRKKLDEGTEFLLKIILKRLGNLNNKTVGDLGGGWGAISLVLGTIFPRSQIIAFENEPSAFQAFLKNTKKLDNVKLYNSDITSLFDKNIEKYYNKMDYIISNPPFHVNTEKRNNICQNMTKLIKTEGQIFVAKGRFVNAYKKSLSVFIKVVESFGYKKFRIIKGGKNQQRKNSGKKIA